MASAVLRRRSRGVHRRFEAQQFLDEQSDQGIVAQQREVLRTASKHDQPVPDRTRPAFAVRLSG